MIERGEVTSRKGPGGLTHTHTRLYIPKRMPTKVHNASVRKKNRAMLPVLC